MTVRGAAFPTTSGHHLAVKIAAPPVSHSIEYRSLPDGDGATFMTLDAMKDAVLGRIPPDYSGYQDQFNINTAYRIAPDYNSPDAIASLFNWVIANITYEPHPINQQTLQDARRTLELQKGDCVSLSVLLATLAMCLGLRPRFIAQWVDGESASHVYVEVHMPDGEWLALDAVAKDQPMGWRQKTLDGGFEVAWEIFNG
jgi:Transglutaminase-like superfamily